MSLAVGVKSLFLNIARKSSEINRSISQGVEPLSKTAEQISTGARINADSDDSAGWNIAIKANIQASGLSQAKTTLLTEMHMFKVSTDALLTARFASGQDAQSSV